MPNFEGSMGPFTVMMGWAGRGSVLHPAIRVLQPAKTMKWRRVMKENSRLTQPTYSC